MFGLHTSYEKILHMSVNKEEIQGRIERFIFYDEGYNNFTRHTLNINEPFISIPSSKNNFIVKTIYHSSLKAVLRIDYHEEEVTIKSMVSDTSRILLNIMIVFIVLIMLLTSLYSILTNTFIPLIYVLAFFSLFRLVLGMMLSTFRRESEWAFELLERCIVDNADISSERYRLLQ